MEKRHRMPV